MMMRPLISRLRESNLTPIALAFVSLATGIVGLAFAALAIFEPETAKKFDFSIFSFIYDSVLFKSVMAGLWLFWRLCIWPFRRLCSGDRCSFTGKPMI